MTDRPHAPATSSFRAADDARDAAGSVARVAPGGSSGSAPLPGAPASLPRSIADVLSDLVDTTTLVITTPAAALGQKRKLEALRTEVAAAIARPAPDCRVVDDRAAMLVTAALHIAGAGWREEDGWLALAEFLLAVVERQFVRAAEQEIRPISRDDLR